MENTDMSSNEIEIENNKINFKKKEKTKQLWNKIKNILKSEQKLSFLSSLPSIDLEIFQRIFVNENEHIVYKSINNKLVDAFGCNLKREIIVKKPINSISKNDLLKYYNEKVDNTGCIDLWPSEEVLAFYCLINSKKFNNKKIIELGSGFSGLSGLLLASNNDSVSEIKLTDGNSQCVIALNNAIEQNKLNLDVKSELLCWDKNLSFEIKYDYILLADCLFFSKYHVDLVKNIKDLLEKDGRCIIFSPPRGKTMEDFLNLCENNHLEIELKSLEFINKLYSLINSGKNSSIENQIVNESTVDELISNNSINKNNNISKVKDVDKESYEIYQIVLKHK